MCAGQFSRPVYPHTRGERNAERPKEPKKHTVQFIPTRVGNILLCGCQPYLHPVYPHPRGEHHSKLEGDSQPLGSSPPAWGTYFLNRLVKLAEEGGGAVVAFGAGPALPVGIGVFGLAGLVDKVGGAMGGEGVEEALPVGEAEFDEAGGAVGEEGDSLTR